MSIEYLNKKIMHQSDYEAIVMINDLEQKITAEYANRNKEIDSSKIFVQGYFYNKIDKNIYLSVLFRISQGGGHRARLLVNYSSYSYTQRFINAANKKEWKVLYQHTKFLINFGSESAWFSFQFIPLNNKFLLRPFAIITALNPNMQQYSDKGNSSAQKKLYELLVKEKYNVQSSMGELSGHSEDSYIIFDISQERALEIGKKFNQQSIVFNDGETVSIIDCESSEKIVTCSHYLKYHEIAQRNDKIFLEQAILNEVSRDNRICLQPPIGEKLWKIVADYKPHTNISDYEVPPPLILSSWSYSTDMDKRERLLEHIEWAKKKNKLLEVYNFLTILTNADCYTGNNIRQNEVSNIISNKQPLMDIATVRHLRNIQGTDVYTYNFKKYSLVSITDIPIAGYLIDAEKTRYTEQELTDNTLLKKDDIIISTRGKIASVAIIGDTKKLLTASPMFTVIRMNESQYAIPMYIYLKSVLHMTV